MNSFHTKQNVPIATRRTLRAPAKVSIERSATSASRPKAGLCVSASTDRRRRTPTKKHLAFVALRDFADLEETSHQGYVEASYARLAALFGKPARERDEYRLTYRWSLRFADGTIVTVYDWKMSRYFRGPEGMTPREIRKARRMTWNVGGRGRRAVRLVCQALRQRRAS